MGNRGLFVRDEALILDASLTPSGALSMNVFVTGAAGFIGGSSATGLVKAGHTVTGLVRSADRSHALPVTDRTRTGNPTKQSSRSPTLDHSPRLAR